jgi:hypothetical protein
MVAAGKKIKRQSIIIENITNNEKDISTIKKTQEKQARFQKKNGNC